KSVKLVVVGDAFVGKTSLIFAYTQQKFIEDYEPTVFQNYSASVILDRRKVNLNLFDTTGSTQEKLVRLRTLSYPQADVVLLCFSLVDPLSLDSCRRRWIPEIRRHTQAPVLLVGIKEDLVERAPLDKRVDRKQALRIAHEIGCQKLLTCSALTLRGLKRVFDEAL
ncbi:UNVERIFIED_CONTAM: Ras-related protein Rac1, partial [Eudyptes robustus]